MGRTQVTLYLFILALTSSLQVASSQTSCWNFQCPPNWIATPSRSCPADGCQTPRDIPACCSRPANCANFICPSGWALKQTPVLISCKGVNCRQPRDTPVCCFRNVPGQQYPYPGVTTVTTTPLLTSTVTTTPIATFTSTPVATSTYTPGPQFTTSNQGLPMYAKGLIAAGSVAAVGGIVGGVVAAVKQQSLVPTLAPNQPTYLVPTPVPTPVPAPVQPRLFAVENTPIAATAPSAAGAMPVVYFLGIAVGIGMLAFAVRSIRRSSSRSVRLPAYRHDAADRHLACETDEEAMECLMQRSDDEPPMPPMTPLE